MTTTHTRLLLVTEQTEHDVPARDLAFALALRDKLPLDVVLPMVSNAEFEQVAPALAARAEALAAHRRNLLLADARAAGVSVQVTSPSGPELHELVVDAAGALANDLIVIRRRGQRGLLARLLVGEMVSRVVAHAPCSVLIAPPGARPWSKAVLVGIDPRCKDTSLLTHAVALARERDLTLRILCVAPDESSCLPAEATLSAATATASQMGVRVDAELRFGRPYQQLLAATQDCGADLLLIGRHGDDNILQAWVGGTAQKVIGLSDCPVLIHVPKHPST
ncbi:MAG: universal stress protein [Burkholderiales bacterium]|nr:universal stress protein [Burkholderiales bacterium]